LCPNNAKLADIAREQISKWKSEGITYEDAANNIIKLSKGKLGVINGLDGYIIAEKDNVLLICKKEDSSALVRKYVNEVQIKKGDEFV